MVDDPKGVGDGEGEEVPQQEPSPLGAAATLEVSRGSRRERRRNTADSDSGGGSRGGSGSGFGSGRLSRFSLTQKVIGALVVLLLLALVPAFVSGLKKTPKNMIGISYGGGPFEAAHFQRVVKPGSALFFNGWFDPLYLYPADQQNYIISLSPRVGATRGKDSIIAPTSDRVPLTYQLAVYFKLNTDLLRQFHEQLGLQYTAYTTSGWNNLLQDTFRQNVENAVQEQTRRYTVAQLYGNTKNLTQLQNAVQTSLGQRLIAALGEPYFCAPTFVSGGRCDPPTFIVKQIDIPTTVLNAFVNQRAAEIQVDQRKAEAESIGELKRAGVDVSGPNYALLKGVESGAISTWVVPSNTGFTINPASGSASPGSAAQGSTTTTTKPGG